MKIPQISSATVKNIIKNKIIKKVKKIVQEQVKNPAFPEKNGNSNFVQRIKKIGKQIRKELWDAIDGMI